MSMNAPLAKTESSLKITGEIAPGYQEILTPEALSFVADLARTFTPTLEKLLARRKEVLAELKAGRKLDFLKETKDIRAGSWKVGPIPKDLQDRRVEITGPVERKMIINALNSGAKAFMADFEDSLTPAGRKWWKGRSTLRMR
jgi:malate synthase